MCLALLPFTNIKSFLLFFKTHLQGTNKMYDKSCQAKLSHFKEIPKPV